MTTIVWVLFFISNGGYNSGNVTYYHDPFKTQEACEAVRKQLYEAEYGAAGRATVLCIEVDAEAAA